MNNHYVFLRPGEKIFILTDDVAGDNDYTHVIEAEIPVHPVPDYDGSPRHRIAPELITARRYATLELNECANLSCGEPANNVLEGYARCNEERATIPTMRSWHVPSAQRPINRSLPWTRKC
jgi:hypothetical protein